MAEWAGFENQCSRKATGGSNPPLSAISRGLTVDRLESNRVRVLKFRLWRGPLCSLRTCCLSQAHPGQALAAICGMCGGVTEWLKEPAWKAGAGQKLAGGSNPPLSAIFPVPTSKRFADV